MHICIGSVNIFKPELCLDGKLDLLLLDVCTACVCCVIHLCITFISSRFIVKLTVFVQSAFCFQFNYFHSLGLPFVVQFTR